VHSDFPKALYLVRKRVFLFAIQQSEGEGMQNHNFAVV
jgi:hypothetical protein